MGDSSRNLFLRYGTAGLAVTLAVSLRLLLDPLLNDRLSFITLFAAVVVTAWYAGRGPGVVTILLGSAAVIRRRRACPSTSGT